MKTGVDQTGTALGGCVMKRKSTYTLTLILFIVMWGLFGFVAAIPAGAQPAAQETVIVPTVVLSPIVNTVVVPGATQLVPVTGNDPAPSVMMLLFYGFLGMLAIVLLVALFASANRTTYVRRDGPPPPPDDL
jgi:hypothetical protein